MNLIRKNGDRDMKIVFGILETLKILEILDNFCKNECKILCKMREKDTKDKCNVKDFINYMINETNEIL